MALLSIKRDVDIVPGVSAPVVFHVSQNDVGTNVILSLLNYGTAYNVPQDTTVTIIGSASNGNVFNPVNATYSGSDVTFRLSEEMSSVAGPALCEAVLVLDDNVLGTANFIINVEASPMGADVPPVFTDAAWDWMLGKFNSEIIPEFNTSLIDAIDSKLDKVFPTDLSGKYLKINSTGHVEPSDIEEIPVDATLSHEGEAADAKATGDALALKANESTIAPEFDSSTSYTAGSYVYKNGVLYKFTSNHSGAWTGTDAVEVTVEGEVTDLKADLYDLRHDMDYYSENKNGIVFTWDKAQSKCTITGTATAVTFNNLFMSKSSLPANIKAGDVLRVKYKSSNVWLIFYDYSGGNLKNIKEVKRDCIVKIPDTCTGLIIRLWVGNGTTVNETVAPEIYKNANCLIESVDTATEDESGKTDMRSIIQEMLDIYRYCKLSPGAFYISDTVIIPEGGTLDGCGESTRIYLTSGDRKKAILLRRYGAVRNLSVIGSYTDLTQSDFGASAGTRYGIHYYKGSSDTYVPAYCSISNVHIRNFTATGIYQYGTGANVEQGLFVSNVHIKNCWCGIWIYSNSEFCRYENVQMTYCYIDCINNGGNNAFNNCVFHAYAIGMKIDGTQSNSAHGMCANSSFCHTGNNTGSALTLDSIANGFVFSSCQFWYNSVDISGCGGIVFSGCEFGRGTTSKGATINITNGNTVMFGNCVFMNDVTYPPDITITNNTKVKFNGCYGSVSGNEIAA